MAKTNSKEYWVGFDLGGTKMLACLYNSKFDLLASKKSKTHGFLGAETGIERIIETIEFVLGDAGVKSEKLSGIGVGCPGPLDLKRGIIREAPNLGWKNIAIKDRLESAFGCSAVISNDVDLGVYGEYRFGAGREARCVLGVFPGTGIGGGCVYEGELIRGSNSSCLEIGHITAVPDGPLCGCGQRGCLESVASRLAIAAAATQAAYRGQAPYLRDACGTDLGNIKSGALASAIQAGDTVVHQIVIEAARHIGIAVGTVVNLLAPDTVVLGGGMVEAMAELFVGQVSIAAHERAMPSLRENFTVTAAELGDEATVRGAAAWAQHCLG